MSKKATIVLVVLVAVAALLYFKLGMKNDTNGTPGTSPTGVSGGATGGSGVTYKCDQNKTFKLSYVDADTVSLSGAGITTVNLNKTAVGYYINTDGKTVVKVAGNYVVLVQKDLVTHDRCVAI